MKTHCSKGEFLLYLTLLLVGAFSALNLGANAASVIVPDIEWVEHTISMSAGDGTSVYAADINGDEYEDVVLTRSDWFSYSEVYWYENDRSKFRSWPEHLVATLPAGCVPTDVVAGDIGGDQGIDIVVAFINIGGCDRDLVWYENPSWTAHVIPQTKSSLADPKGRGPSVALADIDDDGNLDIVWAGTAYLAWYENPSWQEHMIPSTIFLASGTCVFASDLNLDDSVDIVVGTCAEGGPVAWYQNPSWEEHIIGSTSAFDVCAADIDGDEDIDVVAGGCGDPLSFYENTGGATAWTQHTISGGAQAVNAVDLDNDTDVDLVTTSGSWLYWYENGGGSPPSWTQRAIAQIDPRLFDDGYAFPADFDNDGDRDVVGGHGRSNQLRWFQNWLGNPEIIGIEDVGNDQGRQVRVTWERSNYDAAGSPVTITEYGLWRRIDADKSSHSGDENWAAQTTVFEGGRIYPLGEWDFIKTVPARGEPTYNSVCPTLGDSTEAEGMYWSVFFVSAMTSDPLLYYDSDPDSGYSLDNIPPLAVGNLDIPSKSGQTLVLTWMVPGEYPGEESATAYDIRYSSAPVGSDTATWWANATQCTDEPYPAPAGAIDSFAVTLDLTQTYYFAMRLLDDRPNYSEISNIVRFKCGDVNRDDIVNVGDVVYVVSYLYKNGPAPIPGASGDVNCDGIVNVGDVVYLVSYLYKGGPAPCGQ